MPDAQHAIETAAAASVATKAMYTGAGATVLGWFLSSEFGVLVGLVLGIGGFVVNWFYRHRQDKREQRAHEALMASMRQPGDHQP